MRSGRMGWVRGGERGKRPSSTYKKASHKTVHYQQKTSNRLRTIELTTLSTKKMYFRFSTLLPVAALVAVAAAAPSELEARTGTSQCNTGSMECCTFTQTVRFRFPHYSRFRPFR